MITLDAVIETAHSSNASLLIDDHKLSFLLFELEDAFIHLIFLSPHTVGSIYEHALLSRSLFSGFSSDSSFPINFLADKTNLSVGGINDMLFLVFKTLPHSSFMFPRIFYFRILLM